MKNKTSPIIIGLLLITLAGINPTKTSALTLNETKLTNAFKTIRATTIWPVANSSLASVESNFGPRLQMSTGKYDWHRGIDIDAKLGTNVLAAQTGNLWKVTYYPDGGNTIILRHKFPTPIIYNGKTLEYYYTFYMHLNSVSNALTNAIKLNQTPIIPAGTVIGTVGHTGEANIADHLHFELRVGTYCTLEFQIANPNSSCSKGFGFDPAMNALLLIAPIHTPSSITMITKPNATTDGKIKIIMSDQQPLLNRLEFTISNNGKTVTSHTLDFDERTGYNSTSNSTLDAQNKTKPYITPAAFNDKSTFYETYLTIPKTFVGNNYGNNYKNTLMMEDIWGNQKTIGW